MLISPVLGYTLLAAFGLTMLFLTYFFQRNQPVTTNVFLVYNRVAGTLLGSFSIASSWIWAPALFVSSEMAYKYGLAGMLWFCIPNTLTVIFFGPFAYRLRSIAPHGYTLPEFIKARFDNRTHLILLFSFMTLQICSVGTQILGGASAINWLTGIPVVTVAALLTIIVLTYAVISGMRASLITDFIQMTMMILACLIIAPWSIHNAGGIAALKGGLSGFSGKFNNIFNWEVARSFGLIATIGWFSGLLADQQHWQRAFTIKKDKLKITYLMAGLIFAIVPVSLDLLGLLAANPTVNNNWPVPSSQLIGMITMSHLLPSFALVL